MSKKIIPIIVIFALFFGFFQNVSAAGDYCAWVAWREGLTRYVRGKVECFPTLEALKSRLLNYDLAARENTVLGVSIKGGPFYGAQQSVDTANHYVSYKYGPDLGKLYCAQYTERVGTLSTELVPQVICFDSSQACNDAYNASYKGDAQKNIPWQDCDGDGVKQNNGGKDTVDFDGNKIILPEYCFNNEEGKPICDSGEKACNERRTAYIYDLGDNSDAESKISACAPKTPNTPPSNPLPNPNTPPSNPLPNPNTPPSNPLPNPGTPDNTFKVKLSNPLGNNITNINQLLTRFIQIALDIGIILASLAILYSGFLFVKAQGDSKKITDARNRLQWSVIGLAILLASNVIVTIVKSTIESLSVK